MTTDPMRHKQVTLSVGDLHLAQIGDLDGEAILLLHGWPQSWAAWQPVMRLAAADGWCATAIDLPGIGGSASARTDGSTGAIATVVGELLTAEGLEDVTLVGHDLGGMVTYSALRSVPHVQRAVIMDVAVPGVDPWDAVLRNPHIWHFGFHAVPQLPERLVHGHQRAYSDYFFDALAARPDAIPDAMRDTYAEAYATDHALTAGFDWYRAFPRNAEQNRSATTRQPEVPTPVLYLRGEHEPGDLGTYLDGFAAAGLTNVRSGVVPGAGHFAPEEQPHATWQLIRDWSTDQTVAGQAS